MRSFFRGEARPNPAAPPPPQPPSQPLVGQRAVTFGSLPLFRKVAIEPDSFLLAPDALIRTWLQAWSVQVEDGTSREELIRLAQHTLENSSMCFLRDKADGDDDRRAVLEVWHEDLNCKLPWLHKSSAPPTTAPFSSAFLSSPALTPASLRHVLLPLLLSFYSPKTAEMVAKYAGKDEVEKIAKCFSHYVLAAAEQCRPMEICGGGTGRMLR
jgi:hypothetical protein